MPASGSGVSVCLTASSLGQCIALLYPGEASCVQLRGGKCCGIFSCSLVVFLTLFVTCPCAASGFIGVLHPGALWAKSEGAVGYVVLRLSCTCHSDPLSMHAGIVDFLGFGASYYKNKDCRYRVIPSFSFHSAFLSEADMQNGAARQIQDVCVTCDEFSSLSQPYGKALCHFFFFPPCSSRLCQAQSPAYSCDREQETSPL